MGLGGAALYGRPRLRHRIGDVIDVRAQVTHTRLGFDELLLNTLAFVLCGESTSRTPLRHVGRRQDLRLLPRLWVVLQVRKEPQLCLQLQVDELELAEIV